MTMDRLPFPANDAVVRTALAIARDAGRWDAVRMQDVAQAAGIGLAELLREYPDRDAIAEACFDIADQALLALAGEPGWQRLDVRERLQRCIFTWLTALPGRRMV